MLYFRIVQQNVNISMDLEFPEPTASANYVVPTLGLDEGVFIFSYLNAFLSYITPHDLTIGKFKNKL